MAKTDIADAYRLVPLHPSQYKLTGFYFHGYYFDCCLPQGCSSPRQIFEKISDSLLWILNNFFQVYNVVKVLDDFLFLAPTSSSCSRSHNIFRSLCARIGVPLAEHKTEGPVTCIPFLGIEIDSGKMVARLAIDKLKVCSSDISQLLHQQKCTLREFKSLVGILKFFCSVVTGGRSFLRRMYDATIGVGIKSFFLC